MTEQEKHILQNSKKQFYQKEIAYIKTKQGAFESHMLHFDHPLFWGGQDLSSSDGGYGAKQIRESIEEMPLWQKIWLRKRIELKPRPRSILDALTIDWRTHFAAKLAGCNRKMVLRSKKIFKTHFAQCWTAYKRDFDG